MYYFVLAIFLIGVFAIWRIVNSPFGMILRSIRENENRAISLGYSVGRYKLGAFVMSAALAGLAGAHQGDRLPVRDADRRHLADVGRGHPDDAARRHRHHGRARSSAPASSSAWRTTLATSGFPVTIATGVIFMVCVLVFRRGIVGEVYASFPRPGAWPRNE